MSSIDFESGDTQYAKILDAAQTGLRLADTDQQCTFCFWYRPETLATNVDQTIFHKSNDSGGGVACYNFWKDNLNPSWTMAARRAGSVANTQVKFPLPGIVVDEWIHWTLTVEHDLALAEKYTLYRNGIILSADPHGTVDFGDETDGFYDGDGPFWLAGDPGADTVDGKLFDARVYNDLLTPAEIFAACYGGPLANPGAESNLVGNWIVGPEDLVDVSPEGNDLTAFGGPLVYSDDIPDSNIATGRAMTASPSPGGIGFSV